MEIFQQFFFSLSSNVAFLAHIGGFIASMLMMHFFYRGAVEWDPLAFLGSKNTPSKWTVIDDKQANPRGWTVTNDEYANPSKYVAPVTQQELDALLAKLSKDGINSLTAKEHERLRLARQQMLDQRKR